MSRIDFTIEEQENGLRVDKVIFNRLDGVSRALIQSSVEAGNLLVNNRKAKASYRSKPGDEISFSWELPPPLSLTPEELPLNILFQDDHHLVVDKPAGLVVHPGAGIRTGTLANALVYMFEDLPNREELRPGIVHRLDKGTSGLLVVTLHPESKTRFSALFKDRKIHKEYQALVFGAMNEQTGIIDKPIGRHPVQRLKMTTNAPRSRPCLTEWALEREYSGYSLLRVTLHTGRTHQIRVHLASIGRPLVGDVQYGGKRYLQIGDGKIRTKIAKMDRVFLHASRLEYTHPFTGEPMTFESRLPAELLEILRLFQR